MKIKRFASHYLYTSQQGFLRHYMVEIGEDGTVINFTPFLEEIEDVSWFPGVIELVEDASSGKWKAFKLYPFDFEHMKPVSETLRTPLL